MADHDSLHISDLQSTALSSPWAGAPPGQITMEQEIKANRKSRNRRRTKKSPPQTDATALPSLKSVVDFSPDSNQLDESYMNALRARLDPLPHPPATMETETPSLSEGSAGEGSKVPKQKKRKRKEEVAENANVHPLGEGGDDERIPIDNRVVSPPPPLPPSLPQPPPTGVQLEGREPNDPLLLVDDEDVIDTVGGGGGVHQHTNTHDKTQSSLLVTKESNLSNNIVFQQQKDTGVFIHLKGGTGIQGEEGVDSGETVRDMSSPRFVLKVHYFLNTMIMIMHGLIAGLSLWDTSVSYSINAEHSQSTLLFYYHNFPLILHAVYLFTITSIIVILMDRLDVAKVTVECMRSCFQGSLLVIGAAFLLMLIALMSTIVSAFLDSRISLFTDEPTLWSDLLSVSNSTTLRAFTTGNSTLYYALNVNGTSGHATGWLALNLLRTVSLVLSWIILAWVQSTDRLKEYITALTSDSS